MTTFVEVGTDAIAEAREILRQWSAACVLHHRVTRYYCEGYEASWGSQEALLEYYGEEADVPSAIATFELCAECARLEAGVADEGIGYALSEWPCRTAVALGLA